MKNVNSILIMLLFAMAGCSGNKQAADDLITVDVTTNYPKKELVLQDFMDVEYIPLETKDDFITMGWVHAIGKKVIIVRNRNRNTDGDIFIFDRNGKGVRKINRLGQSAEEYQFLLGITLDEDNDEIFVNDHWTGKIFVYDLFGKFKRSFKHQQGWYSMDIYNFDRDNLICRANNIDEENSNAFLVISKQDGSITKEITIPNKKKITSLVFLPGSNNVMPIRNRTFVPQSGGWMLMEDGSDTIYTIRADYSMTPLIVRTPPIESMKPGVFLYPAVLTDGSCFMQTVKAEWDWGTNTGHKRTDLMYDKQENAIYEYVMHNADFTNAEPGSLMVSEVTFGNDEIALVQKLEAYELVEAYEKGKLKGKLKEIAAELNEESNPVLMLIKYKK
ncbi:6-bladed beta-propeller [uncultured Parabacteroides sp.]|uniref:6-bladed beta-propeller n=1 Tax=uncultured Parabacteroides sp. TaxID=512312 RepID=UPI0025FA806D|nr:6-bladed beta-propeller [uncultured Parabacteroides sp.]